MKLTIRKQAPRDKLTRVNPTAILNVTLIKRNDKNPASYVSGGAVLTDHHPDAAPPPRNSVWDRPNYEPKPASVVRSGADIHLNYKSRGV